MKKPHSVDKGTKVSKPVRKVALSDEPKSNAPNESLGLSPQRVSQGASFETTLLTKILAQRQELPRLRH